MPRIVRIYVVIATKGRRAEAGFLIESLRRQTVVPAAVLTVGASADDLPSVVRGPAPSFRVEAWVAASAGLTVQRNEAIRRLRERGQLEAGALVVFFDDDFRPADDWLERCAALVSAKPDIVGVTGCVLADGVHGVPLGENEAVAYLTGARAPEPHWASGAMRETKSVYGCNMAFTGEVMKTCLFDESLPLYGWQEDRDMTGQARRLGRVVFAPECQGVHLGAKGGRTSGVRFGYSQIANMVYLHRKGTVETVIVARFLVKALAANIVRSIVRRRDIAHFGRLRGNVRACADLLRGRCEPRKILTIP